MRYILTCMVLLFPIGIYGLVEVEYFKKHGVELRWWFGSAWATILTVLLILRIWNIIE